MPIKIKKERSEYEIAFHTHLRQFSIFPDYVMEYKFYKKRKWRFDFAWPHKKCAVEIDGGQWLVSGGRHNRDSDREKMNVAQLEGWTVLRFSGDQIKNDPGGCIDMVKELLK